MIPKIIAARHVQGFVIHLRFADGTEGDVNFDSELDGDVFLPLKNLSYFKEFILHPDLHTLTWPNGADFAPEFLYDKIQIPA